MPVPADLKKLLTETIGADESTKVVESLEAFYTKTVAEAEASKKGAITEAVKAEKIKLEASYLEKLEEAKEAGDKTIKEELTKYEKLLAERVKGLLVSAIDSHGDRLARIAEQTEAKRGSALLEEVEKLITKGKAEITEGAKVDPKEVTDLKTKVAALEEQIKGEKKKVLEQTARANVAEGTVKELRESLETSLQVTVEETAPTKGTSANEEHLDSTGKGEKVIAEGEQGTQKGFSPQMERMRRLAGIKK
jgi:hypothetical protein